MVLPMESRHAAIPSVNVCMNCHKTINEYTKGPELTRADGTKVDGTKEIQKLYSFAGFDPKNAAAWDPSKAKPITWTKIHNLPDHVYFNHSQHIKAGKVAVPVLSWRDHRTWMKCTILRIKHGLVR
jgi:hypothetical protein